MLDVAALLPEGAHDPDPRQRLAEVAGDRGDLLPGCPVGPGRGDPECERAEEQQGQRDEGQQRQVDVHHHEDHHDTDQHQAALDQRGQPILDELVQSLDVVGHAADDDTGDVAAVEADRQRLQVGEQLQAQILQRPLTDPADQVRLGVGGDAVHRRRDEEDDDHDGQHAGVVLLDALVDGDLGQRRRRQCGRRGEHERREHGQHAPAVWRQDLDQAAQLATVTARLPEAAAQLGAGVRAHRPATSAVLRVRNT